jgi:hypothetical protein
MLLFGDLMDNVGIHERTCIKVNVNGLFHFALSRVLRAVLGILSSAGAFIAYKNTGG